MIVKESLTLSILGQEQDISFNSAGYAGMMPVYANLSDLLNDYPQAEYMEVKW